MYFLVLTLCIATIALVVVVFKRETSLLYILPLLGVISLGFVTASFFQIGTFLFMGSALASGYVAWLARDELRPGRPWLWLAVVLGVGASGVFFYRHELAIAQGSASVALGAFVAVFLSYYRPWTRMRGQWESKV